MSTLAVKGERGVYVRGVDAWPMSSSDEGRLSLVGLGLEPDGISLAGRRAARAADRVFLEAYTAQAPQPVASLEAMVEADVEPLDRAGVEDGDVIVDAARGAHAALLVAGDPLSATTHTALRLQALEAGLSVDVHHAGSVLTAAAGALGLSHYKFGRTTTLVTPQDSYFPQSPYEVVQENSERGLHTLVLLDVREDGSFMSAAEGARLLARLEDEQGEGALPDEREVVAIARAGRPDERAWRGSLAAIQKLDAGEPMHSLVVPGELSPVEEEALAAFATAP
jgi:diphthine synthase